MIYAIPHGETKRQPPTPGASGSCPFCGSGVIAKCGRVNAWHWAHECREDCDPWHDGETEWHRRWKRRFPKESTEKTLVWGDVRHIADLWLPNSIVVEFQHSPLTVEEIREREAFYGRMVWIFDVSDCRERFHFRRRDGYVTFRWKHPRKHIAFCRRVVYLDFGLRRLFRLMKVSEETPCGGWGRGVDVNSWVRDAAHGWLTFPEYGNPIQFTNPRPPGASRTNPSTKREGRGFLR